MTCPILTAVMPSLLSVQSCIPQPVEAGVALSTLLLELEIVRTAASMQITRITTSVKLVWDYPAPAAPMQFSDGSSIMFGDNQEVIYA